MSRAFLNRLEKLKGTISSIGQDDLHLRVPVTQGGDEFDQLSKMINGMLSRIETLVREVQGVSANIALRGKTFLSSLLREPQRSFES
nr:hypothetical protein HAGR004_41440 [Bdellovibrio sp. HAGR004]